MTVRRKGKVGLDAGKGLYFRNLGKLRSGTQPKFWLGQDRGQAEQRNSRLETLWQAVLQQGQTAWPELVLDAAKSIARGEETFQVPFVDRGSDFDYPHYFKLMSGLNRQYPQVQWIPEDTVAFETGIRDLAESFARIKEAASDNMPIQIAATAPHERLHHAFDGWISELDSVATLKVWNKNRLSMACQWRPS
jgi:hypothetical protein